MGVTGLPARGGPRVNRNAAGSVARRPGRAVRAAAVASLVANVGIVLTGGAVRLTGSGLGCPSWPRCTDESYVAHGELGLHGAIEFGNRMLTFTVALVALVTVVVVWRAGLGSRVPLRLALVLAVGVPAQAVIGGVTVLTDLNPWVVAGHLLLSMAMISLAVALVHHTGRGGDSPAAAEVPATAGPAARALRTLAFLTFAATWLVLYLGTVVTGSGPHAGDRDAPRNGLDPATVSQLHADAVFLLVGLSVGVVLAARAAGAPGRVATAAQWLLGVELLQGLVGFVQYATDLPAVLVEVHLLGASATVAAATALLLSVRAVQPDPADRAVVNAG